MHKVVNFGSALQACALLKKIRDLGYDAELIDYKYPNAIHKEGQSLLREAIKQTIHFLNSAIVGFPTIRQKIRYKKFWKENFVLSSQKYPTPQSIENNPPIYDIYVTGSDQVWNANFTKKDSSFLLSFAPEGAKKIAYSSSFALNTIPDEYECLFAKYLPLYKHISVREESGVDLANKYGKTTAEWVCDPTLLLTKQEWANIAKGGKSYKKQPYILVFLLAYSFDPFPDVDFIVNKVQKELGLHVIYLDAGKRDYFKPNSHVVKDAGPKEFINLFLDAEFIITSSFHGTAFSINFGKPFLSIIELNNPDSRIGSLLKKIGLEEYGVPYNSKDIVIPTRPRNLSKLIEFREYSLSYLKNSISN